MNTKSMLVAALAAALLTGSAYAQTQVQGDTGSSAAPTAGSSQNQTDVQKASKADQAFMKEAIQGDLAEVQMGQLAQEKGQSQEVKQFGKMLQQDHGQHLQQAQQMAQRIGVTPPTDPNAKQKAMHDKLSKMSGAQFDKAFAQDMVKDHKEDIAKYQKEAKSKGPLAEFAQQTVPVLQKHLKTAQSFQQAGAAVGSGNRNAR